MLNPLLLLVFAFQLQHVSCIATCFFAEVSAVQSQPTTNGTLQSLKRGPCYWEFLFNRGQIHDVALLSRKNYGEISVPTMGITNSSIKPHQQVQKHNEVNISFLLLSLRQKNFD
jgi:hypothetical protein